MKFLNIRYNRAVYWMGLAVLAAFYVIATLALAKPVRFQEFMLAFLCVPRLHDIGRSGWWAVVALMGEFCLAVALLLLALTSRLSQDGISVLAGLLTLAVFAAVAWLGAVPGQTQSNRWGDSPPPGLRGWKVKAGPRATGPYPPNA